LATSNTVVNLKDGTSEQNKDDFFLINNVSPFGIVHDLSKLRYYKKILRKSDLHHIKVDKLRDPISQVKKIPPRA